MASVSITLNGVIYPKGRSASDQPIPATFVGEAWLTGLEVGGGPLPGGPPSGGGGQPPGMPTFPIAGYPDFPYPSQPIYRPGYPGGAPPPNLPTPVPPDTPNVPPPGSPPVIIGGTTPVHPIQPPDAIIVEYPGVGKVIVPKPTETQQPQQGGQQ